MFNKVKFANILKKINETYDNQVSFASASDMNRTYLSQYINMKLDNPPSPKILKGIAQASRGITTYSELMEICGHINLTNVYMQPIDKKVNCIPLLSDFNFDKEDLYDENFIIDYIPFNLEIDDINNIDKYFAYKVSDDSMLPLLGVGDIAIIEKTNIYENGQTYLCSLDNKEVLIRKLLDFKDYIELHTVISYNPPIKLTKDDIKNKNFTILGKVIKAEINFK